MAGYSAASQFAQEVFAMPRSILNLEDIELHPRPEAYAPKGEAAGRYDAKVAFIGTQLGAKKLGYNVTAIAPGKRAYPFHNHQVNEEMFLILQGSGELRYSEDVVPIRKGDIIACPAGGPETAHQIVNAGSEELRYFAVSTRLSPDIAEYPDTGRFGLLAELAPSADGQPRRMMFVGRENKTLDYWQGE
jgi:uncharacterized cupin superfamily protein